MYNFEFTKDGVTLNQTDMGFVPDQDVSMHRQQAGMKGKQLLSREGQRLLLREWACTNAACPSSRAPAIADLPFNQNGRAHYPECRYPLREPARRGKRSS